MKYAFLPPAISTVPVVVTGGTAAALFFPVHRIYCVGRNYADHAIEMGGDPSREQPFFFAKPADAVVPCGCSSSSSDDTATTKNIPYPLATADLHHEIELVLAIGRAGTEIDVADAGNYVYGYAIGVDLTRRDLQATAKANGRPWCTAKGFDQSAPIGNIYPTATTLRATLLLQDSKSKNELWLNVNGQRRQTGVPAKQMIWSVSEIISILSHQFELRPGDLIFTGTPAGVAALQPGDRVTGGMDGLGELAFTVTPRREGKTD